LPIQNIKKVTERGISNHDLIGEKLLNSLEEPCNPTIGPEGPAFVAEIKTVFELWEVVEYLDNGWRTPWDTSIYEESTARASRNCS